VEERLANLIAKTAAEFTKLGETEADAARQAAMAREDEAARAEAERHLNARWRANLKQYAPIEKWESAWRATPSAEWPATMAGRDWLDGGCKKHLLILGAVGTGKSVAAASIVKQWVRPGDGFQPVSWLRPNDVVSAVMHAYDDDAPKLCRRIVIDDVGTETKADFSVAMCELLDRPDLTIVMTSNLMKVDPDKKGRSFRERYDLRLVDRLNDMVTTFIVPGGSRRSQEGGL